MNVPPVVPDFRLVDIDEARRITNLSDRFLRDEIKAANLPARKVGRSIRIELAELIDWYRALPKASA
jgi:excisionase family DNA binding protein